MKLIDEKVIEDAAYAESVLTFGVENNKQIDRGNFYNGFVAGVTFTQQQLQPFIIEAIEWVYKGDHPYSHDAFCIGENRNKWHDDDGNFITTQQLLEEFINFKTKQLWLG